MTWIAIATTVMLGGTVVAAYLKLMAKVMQHAVRAADVLLWLIGAGILFVAGFSTARFGLEIPEQPSLFVGIAIPVAYAIGRLSWVALGLPTPWSDYERWRNEDHRDYWNL